MARMSVDLLGRCTGQTRRKRGETIESLLQRVTHLYCSERGISNIEGLSSCHSLSVLYLYNNSISHIEGLASCGNLTHLYLQNNHISHLEGLSTLHRLSKLYLSDNAISVVEGLEGCGELSELHIAHQRLPEGEKLHFDPRTLQAISSVLTLLNVSGNGLDSLQELSPLKKLACIIATDNLLSSMKDLDSTLSQWTGIERVELSRNPLCSKNKYRDRVITMTTRMRVLDGREVTETERKFLSSWKATRKARRKALQQQEIQKEAIGVSSHVVFSTDPPPPLTMPALPARSPLRQWKRFRQVRRNDQAISLPAIVQEQQSSFADFTTFQTSPGLKNSSHRNAGGTRAGGSVPILPNILQTHS